MLALGRLLRFSLAPSALADIAAGIVLGSAIWPSGWRPFALMLASSLVYHGGMALNDWADRKEDAEGGRPRPIPLGEISALAAFALGVCLLLGGPFLAWVVAPRCALMLAGVSACAALYDLAGRGPWRGPLLLALCRAGNLGAGLAFAGTVAPWRPLLWLAPLAYGTYVFVVSRLARLEDLDPTRYGNSRLHPRRWVVGVGLALIATGCVSAFLAFHPTDPVPFGFLWRLAFLAPGLTLLGSIGLFARARQSPETEWGPKEIQGAAGMGLRRLLVASSALALGASTVTGLTVAVGILLGYPVSFALRRVFPPT